MKTPQTVIARNEATAELCQSRNGYSILGYLSQVVFIVSFFLLSLNALAQGRDTTRRDTSKKLGWAAVLNSLGNDPIVIIDDVEGKEKLDKLDPNSIQSLTILKDSSATAIYGPTGKKGVVLVTTMQFAKNKYQTVLTYFSYEYAQTIHANKDDGDFTYIIDGASFKGSNRDCTNKLCQLQAHNIASVKFGNKGGNTGHSVIVIITTKQ